METQWLWGQVESYINMEGSNVHLVQDIHHVLHSDKYTFWHDLYCGQIEDGFGTFGTGSDEKKGKLSDLTLCALCH